MTTATPRPVLPRALPSAAPSVRPAHREDAAALAALSRPFVHTGAVRERPLSLYAAHASDFLVVTAPDGTLEGCLALRVHPADPGRDHVPAGVLYNFCVARHRQGCGTGARLLRTALARARAQSLGALFTATTGGGGLFLRHGFTPASASLAPPEWVSSLDPRRNSRVLARSLGPLR
ncbi:GNAT family N-acetyltransferase [Streptomyces ferrugineus]|uniref:GNAT family N-acetyltransferase n=1 Tax=Streptomyces ferrugineus TaxID=1413221 RepID=UPI001D13B2C4|nr:GNAT family N-acetyltransferase [Streptomyces ferrugineus]